MTIDPIKPITLIYYYPGVSRPAISLASWSQHEGCEATLVKCGELEVRPEYLISVSGNIPEEVLDVYRRQPGCKVFGQEDII